MKKSIALLVALILAMSTVTNVFAKEDFVPALPSNGEGHLSIFSEKTREYKNGEWADCGETTLCHCIQLYHVLESSPDANFYSSFFHGDYIVNPIGTVYKDCSSSMSTLFPIGTSKIINNLSPFINEEKKNVKDIFKNKESDLYGFLNSFKKTNVCDYIINIPDKVPIIISDLFNRNCNESNWLYCGEIVFCVPFASSNPEYVLQCEKVVNDILWNHSFLLGYISIFVVYTDDVIAEYSNGYFNGDRGCIKVYVP